MVRPIRIPQAEVGLGGPAALPSIAAQTAPARAAAQLGQVAAGAVGGVAQDIVTRENNLTFVREGAEAQAKLSAGLAGAKETLQDFVRSPEYNDNDYAALREQLFDRAYSEALEGVTNPQIRARLEGQRDGVLEADLTAELEDNALTQDSVAIEATGDSAIRFLDALGPDGVDQTVASAGAMLDRILDGRPELRRQVQAERGRILQAVQSTFLADGAKGELRYQIALSDGTLDPLGLDTIGRAASKAADRRADLLSEMAAAAALDDDYGSFTDTGQRFAGFTNVPEINELEAIKLDAQGLPEFERDLVVRQLDVMIARRTRRASAMKWVQAFNNEESNRLPHLGQYPEVEEAYNAHFDGPVREWLMDDAVPTEDKTAFLQRSLLSLGVVPRAMQKWIQEEIRTTAPNPERIRAIADAFAAVDPSPLPGATGQPSGGQTIGAQVNMKWLKDGEKDLLRFVARNAGEGPRSAALAYQNALDFQQAQRSGGGGSAPGSVPRDADSKAARLAEEADEELRERIALVHGAPVHVIGDNVLQRIRERTVAEAHRLINTPGTGLTESEALESAADLAIRGVLDVDPPVRLFDRVFMSGPLNAVLQDGKYTPTMIEIELEDAFEKAGENLDEGDLKDNFVLFQEAGMAPGDFRVLILGNEEEPARFLQGPDGHAIIRLRGSESVQQKTIEGLRLAGMEKAARAAAGRSREEFQKVRDDLISATFLDRGEFIDRFASAYELMLTPFGLDDFTPIGERLRIAESADELEARRNNLFRRVKEGRPLYTVRPELEASWTREYEAKLKELQSFAQHLPIRDPRRNFLDRQNLDRRARSSADQVVRIELERQLGGATIQQITRFFETGLYPDEEGPGGPPLREAIPIGPGLPDIGLEDAFSPLKILEQQRREREGRP